MNWKLNGLFLGAVSSLTLCFAVIASTAEIKESVPAGSVSGHSSSATSGSAFHGAFLHPPPSSRILKIIHNWPDAPSAQDALISSLSRQGFGGVVCNVSFSEYLQSEAKWQALARAVEQARKAGFALWLYDEKGYPSGTAGGLVLRDHPDWEARGLLVADAEVEAGPMKLPVPPGEPFLTAAFPLRDGLMATREATNLSPCVKDGQLAWQAPAGRWRVMAITTSRLFEGTHASMSLSEHIPYPNLLDPEPTARFVQLTHQGYAQHLGDNLGQWFAATFTDEPSLMSLFLRQMPYRVLPWSSHLAAEFQSRRGYALAADVPALLGDVGPKTKRIRYDYWKTVGELVSENYFGQIQQWCRNHHVLSGGHLLMEENLANQVPLYGDFFQCLRRLDAPGIDCLTSIPEQVPWFIARLAGSAADLQKRAVTMCETSDHAQRYRPAGDQRPVRRVTEAEIRGTCNRLVVGGIDTITSYYSFDGLADDQLRALNDYVGRCCASLKGGYRVADLAVVYPTESVWPEFTPAHHYANDSPTATRIETIFHDVSETLFAADRDFTYVDGRALSDAQVESGSLVHGGLRWRVLVLPAADTLPLKAWQNMAQLVESGGVLAAIGNLPANSEREFPSPEVQRLAQKIFGPGGEEPRVHVDPSGGGGIFLPSGVATLLPALLDRFLPPDMKATGNSSALRFTHRRIDGGEIYFVINDSAKPWDGNISFSASGSGEQCDPETGEVGSPSASTDIPLSLAAYGGIIFRYPEAPTPARLKLNKEIIPVMAFRDLPEVTPEVGHGEFVREQLTRETTTNGPAWRAAATLTKSQVDTYLFLRFAYPQGTDFQNLESLVLDSWAPEGQHAPTQLLAILHKKNGADYLASTGRLLNMAGHERSWVPLARFQLAGWSNDPDSHLDLAQITEIRIGWGGYYGTENEHVWFTVASPRMALRPRISEK